MTTELQPPKKHAELIADLEARLVEKNKQARSPDPKKFVFKLPELKVINIFRDSPRAVVLYFMKKYRLITLKDIGDFCGVTRQRIDVLMNKDRSDDFKEIQKDVKKYLNPLDIPSDPTNLKGEKWLPLENIDGRKVDGEYHVSNKGRVTIVAKKTVGGDIYSYRKLIMCKPDQNDRIRVGIKFELSEEEELLFKEIQKERDEAKKNGLRLDQERTKEQPKKRDNFYVNKLVAQEFVPNPDPEELTVISYKDNDFSNNSADNLFWESKSDSLIRNRSPKMKKEKDSKVA